MVQIIRGSTMRPWAWLHSLSVGRACSGGRCFRKPCSKQPRYLFDVVPCHALAGAAAAGAVARACGFTSGSVFGSGSSGSGVDTGATVEEAALEDAYHLCHALGHASNRAKATIWLNDGALGLDHLQRL